MRFTKKTAGLTVGQIASTAPHQFRQNNKGRQIALSAKKITCNCASVRRLDATEKTSAGLHDLPTSIVHSRATVVNGSNERKLVSNLRVMWKENGEETFFKLVRSTTPLMRMFRAYAPKASGYLEEEVHVTQLVFYLPGSEERIEEGWQTGDDLGLADGSMIDAVLYAEHPVGLREQATAAAAAADAARQYLEHLRADERFLGAEDAEEAIAHAAACGLD